MPSRKTLAIASILAATTLTPSLARAASNPAVAAPDVSAEGSTAAASGASPKASSQAQAAPSAPTGQASAPPGSRASAAAGQRPALKGFDPQLIDRSGDPCVDFYRYACGGWLDRNPVPSDRPAWGRDSELSDRNLDLLKTILDQVSARSAKRTASEQKVGDYYASCMDEKAVEEAAAGPLKKELERINSLSSKKEIGDVLARLHALGAGALFTFTSDQDFKDATTVIAEIDQNGLGLPERDYYLREDPQSAELRKSYAAHVASMFRLLGDEPERAESSAQKVVDIETALARVSLDVVQRRDPVNLYHKLAIANVRALSPTFDWDTYVKRTGAPSVREINVTVPEFFKGMEQVLQKEDLPSLKAYLRWHLVHTAAPYLSAAFVNENFAFYGQRLFGAKELRPRWKRCAQYVDQSLGEALGQAYVVRAFPPESKTRTLKLVKDIEAAMSRNIASLDWMSDETKKRAHEKLALVSNKIGYPDKWRDYGALKIVRRDFFGNVQRGEAFESSRQLAKIGRPVDRGEWFMSPPTVNAYYNPQLNDINFPAGILQPPYFDPAMDDAVNYGDAGGVIGHELTHGFDDEGRQFDGRGNLNEWWTPEDEKKFEERASCVEKQYSSYVAMDDVKVNGKLTLGENVADLGGVRLAYSALMANLGERSPEKIDGFTAEQRFFMAYSQGWCMNYTDELARLLAQTDPHAPNGSRVNGVVSNLPEFARAFSCKADQPMVRETPCRVW